ncbi:MAG: alpha/beta fold hydrolase [Chloroflexi bacterium]|nr:alpha/beta fold hydrolase [Chloroflexota bacterium]
MRKLLASTIFGLLLFAIPATAQAPHPEPITLSRDAATLAADFHPAADDAPVILLLHMLNSNRAAWDPLIPDLRAAGYALLNIDLRGHGDSGGARDWDAAIADVTAGWVGWLGEAGHLSESGLAIIGGSIGANVALISCAQVEICRGAVALSPGLDYRGVKPESALVEGLADRAALLVAAQNDASSSTAIRQMFLKAKGDVTARLYRGRAHGTRLFDSEYDSVSRLILGWLAEILATNTE